MSEPDSDRLASIAAMPLERAWLCEDCKAITNRPRCAYCASDAVHPVAALLGERKESKEP